MLEAGDAGNASIREAIFRFGEAGEGLIAAASGSRLPAHCCNYQKGGRFKPRTIGRT